MLPHHDAPYHYGPHAGPSAPDHDIDIDSEAVPFSTTDETAPRPHGRSAVLDTLLALQHRHEIMLHHLLRMATELASLEALIKEEGTP